MLAEQCLVFFRFETLCDNFLLIVKLAPWVRWRKDVADHRQIDLVRSYRCSFGILAANNQWRRSNEAVLKIEALAPNN